MHENTNRLKQHVALCLVAFGISPLTACARPTATASPSPIPPTTTPGETPTATRRTFPSSTPAATYTPLPSATRTPVLSATPVDLVAHDLPTTGPMSLASVDAPLMVHWFEGRRDSDLLLVRDRNGAVAATWRVPDRAEIRHLSEAISPDGRYLTWLSGMRPDKYLVGPIDPPLRLHIQDLLTGEERFNQVLLRPGILDDLRRQVVTVEGWTPTSETPGKWVLAEQFSSVISGVFEDGVGRAAWSPDGTRLAVVAALDGPTSDLYVLDRSHFTLERLTHEPEHVTFVNWSPDGLKLIYDAGLEPQVILFRYRATYIVDAVSGAGHRFPTAEPNPRRPWGPSSKSLDNRGGSNAEGRPVGWTQQGQAIMEKFIHCHFCALARYDPDTGNETKILTSSLPDPTYRLAMMPWGDWYAISGTVPQDGQEPYYGTYLFNLVEGGMQLVDELPRQLEYWGLDDYPFIMLDGLDVDSGRQGNRTPIPMPPMPPMAFGPDGRRLRIEGLLSSSVVVSPDRRWRVACGGRGCKVYGYGPRPIGGWTNVSASQQIDESLIFAPDGSNVAFISEGYLYLASMPDGKPQRLSAWAGGAAGAVLTDELSWLGPARLR